MKTIPMIIILTLVLLSFTSVITAEKLTFEKAIELGKENNYEIEQKREAIIELERQRAIIEAGIDWRLGVKSNPNQYSGPVPTLSITDNKEELGISLQGGKTTINGLSINSSLSLETDISKIKNLDEKYNFSLNVSKRLYPILPTQTEKNLILKDNELIIAKDELDLIENRKEVDWLESYLMILRLKERLEYSKKSYQIAFDELDLVKAQVKIGEAGQDQLLLAKINLQEAKLQQDQLLTSILQAEDNLSLELGLTASNIKFNKSDSYVSRFVNKLDSINLNDIDEEVVKLIKNNNVQLREIMLNKDYAENQLEWQLKDDDLKVDAFGAYNYNAAAMNEKDSVQVGVDISYDFYDGGQQELAVKGIKSKIKNLDKQYAHTLEQLKLQLNGMINEQKLNKMKLNSTKTGLEKARLVEKLYKNQLNEGLITENQYKQKALAVNQAEVDYKESKDQLLLGKLGIALFLGLY